MGFTAQCFYVLIHLTVWEVPNQDDVGSCLFTAVTP